MPKSELLTTILSDYKKTSGDEQQAVIEKFCDFFCSWLGEKNPVGFGHAFNNGIIIKFADNSELSLFAPDNPVPESLPYFNITGNNGGSVRAASSNGVDTSVSITRS